MRLKPSWLIPAAAATAILLGTAGCSSTHQKTQKEEATEHWNAARAAVLAGLARDQYQSGNFDKCGQTLTEAIRMEPKNARLHVMAGKLAIEQAKLETADRELAMARELDPKDAEADYLSGVVCQRWQKDDDALACYERAATKAPNELPYVLAKAEMLVALDRTDDALSLLQDRMVFFEHSAVIRDAVGQILVQKQRYSEAVDVLRQASVLATDDQGIREHLAFAMLFNKQYHEASDLFTRVMKDPANEKRVELFLAQGECQLQTHKLIDARGSFESAVQLNPSSVEALTGLAKAALGLNDLRRADLAVRKAVALKPNSSELYLLTGYIRLKEKKMQEALEAFGHASQLDRKDTVSLCMIGYVLEKTGHSDRALEYYSRALHVQPDDAMAKSLMGSVAAVETGE
jgi:tetratricopeptide (TPR) repeat protein